MLSTTLFKRQSSVRFSFSSFLGYSLLLVFVGLSSSFLSAQCTEDFPIGSTDWIVPEGVTSISIFVSGGGGGDGGNGGSADAGANPGGQGGQGGNGLSFTAADIPVTPGHTLRIIVGAAGADGANGANNGAGTGGDGGGGGSGGNVSAIINLTTGEAIAIAPGGGGAGGGGGGSIINNGVGTGGQGGDGGDAEGNNPILATLLVNSMLVTPPPSASPLEPINETRGKPGRLGQGGTVIRGVPGAPSPPIAPPFFTQNDGFGGSGGRGGTGGTFNFITANVGGSPGEQGPNEVDGSGGTGFAGGGFAFLLGAPSGELIPGSEATNERDGEVEITYDDGTCDVEDLPAIPIGYLYLFGLSLLLLSLIISKRLLF